MSDHKLTTPRMRVYLDNPAGGYTEYDVQTDNRDLVRFDLIRSRMGWPTSKDAPMLWMTVLAWNALKRSGVDVAEVETFLDTVAQLVPLDENGDEAQPGTELAAAAPLA